MHTEDPQKISRPLEQILVVCGLCVTLLGLLAELLHSLTGIHRYDDVLALLSLSYEQNLPTWYSTILLFCAGLFLWRQADRAQSYRVHWRAMSCALFLASLDESAELHERLGGLVGGSGVLYFDWIIPAAAAMLLLALLYIPFLRHLPSQTRRRFVIAGAVYLGGALAMELPLGYWTESRGADNLGYALIDWIEESLEILGASLFLIALNTEETQ